jgi:hypothetical protein
VTRFEASGIYVGNGIAFVNTGADLNTLGVSEGVWDLLGAPRNLVVVSVTAINVGPLAKPTPFPPRLTEVPYEYLLPVLTAHGFGTGGRTVRLCWCIHRQGAIVPPLRRPVRAGRLPGRIGLFVQTFAGLGASGRDVRLAAEIVTSIHPLTNPDS